MIKPNRHVLRVLADIGNEFVQHVAGLFSNYDTVVCHGIDLNRRGLSALCQGADFGVQRQHVGLAGDLFNNGNFPHNIVHCGNGLNDGLAAFAGMFGGLRCELFGLQGIIGVLPDRRFGIMRETSGTCQNFNPRQGHISCS